MSCNPIWNFFEKLECDKSRALCKECGNTYSLGSDKPKGQSVTGLKKHLQRHHPDQYRLFRLPSLEMSRNPIWNFFEKLDCDKSRALCKECGNTYSLGSDKPKGQSVTGLKKHLQIHHPDRYRLFTKRAAVVQYEKSAKRIKQEYMEMECPEMFELPNFVDFAMQPETETKSCSESDVQNEDLMHASQESSSPPNFADSEMPPETEQCSESYVQNGHSTPDLKVSRNPLWNYFEKLECDRRRAMCRMCGNMYSLGSETPKLQSLSGLKYHLRVNHNDEYEQYTAQRALIRKPKSLPSGRESGRQRGDLTGAFLIRLLSFCITRAATD